MGIDCNIQLATISMMNNLEVGTHEVLFPKFGRRIAQTVLVFAMFAKQGYYMHSPYGPGCVHISPPTEDQSCCIYRALTSSTAQMSYFP